MFRLGLSRFEIKVLFVNVRFSGLADCTIHTAHLVHYTKTQKIGSRTLDPLCIEIVEGFYD